MTRAQLDKHPAEVSAMFDAVAKRYDLLNDVLSFGQDRRWRSIVARLAAARAGDVVLDVAAGTGTSSLTFTTSGARCVACDFSLGMLGVGASRQVARSAGAGTARARSVGAGTAGAGAAGASTAGVSTARASPVSFAAGDATRLPFADAMFDVVTISFGLRNVSDADAALAEMLRVTRPGGKLIICEFSHMPPRWLDAVYQRYLAGALPAIARRLSGNPEAYSYLAESIKDWPGQRELADRIGAAGWSSVSWRNITWGVVAVHLGRRPL